MGDSEQFGQWLKSFLESEGKYSHDQLAVWVSRAKRKKISFPAYLESAGVMKSHEINSYLVKFKRVQKASSRNDAFSPSPEEKDEDEPFVIKDGILQPGTVLGGYKIISLIGLGGMGVVYRAEQKSLRRQVALKILKPGKSVDEEYRRRFLNEAIMAAELSHKNIVRAYEAGQIRNLLFFSMELVDGENYQQILDRRKAIPQHQVITILLHMCDALSHARAKGIVHGDIKPANILRDSTGIPKLADLGLAKKSFEETKRLFGTFHYISPETIQGIPADIRSDIYSLGATAYHLATGYPPFANLKKDELLDAHLNDPIPDPAILVPELDNSFSTLIEWMTRKNPDGRPQTPQQLAKWIEESFGPDEPEPTPIFVEPRAAKPVPSARRSAQNIAIQKKNSSMHPLFIAMIMLIIIGLGGFFIFNKIRNESEHQPKATTKAAETLSPSYFVQKTTGPEFKSYEHAKGLFNERKGNFAAVLEYIEKKLPSCQSEEKSRLIELKQELIAARAEKYKKVKQLHIDRIMAMCQKGKYRDALKEAQQITIPEAWGYKKDSPEVKDTAHEIGLMVVQYFKDKLAEVDALIEKKQYDAAQTILDGLGSQLIPGLDRKLVLMIRKLENARDGITPATPDGSGSSEEANIEKRTPAPKEKDAYKFLSYKQALELLMIFIAEGHTDAMATLVRQMKSSSILNREVDNVKHLDQDVVPLLEFWSSIFSYLEKCVSSGKAISIKFTNGDLVTGKIDHSEDGFTITPKDGESIEVRFSKITLGSLETLASKGGYKLSENQLAKSLLLCSRKKWEEGVKEFGLVSASALTARWAYRINLISPIKVKIEASPDHSDEALKLYNQLLQAFHDEDWKKVMEYSDKLLGEYADTDCVIKNIDTIREMRSIASGDNVEDANANQQTKVSYNFKKHDDRDEFFYRRIEDGVGSVGFDSTGAAFVESGNDGLLILKSSVTGMVRLSFELNIAAGSELRVAFKNNQLGRGFRFTDKGFGIYGKELMGYEKTGKKVTMEIQNSTVKIILDNKQEIEFVQQGKRTNYIAFYLLGKGVKVSDVVIEGIFGVKTFTPAQVLRYFDMPGFKRMRETDLPKE